MIKAKIDKYELLGSLGMGGFSSIYKAVSGDGNIVALKKLNSHLLDNPKIIDKFFHEAKILSKLNHPNICRLLDFFAEDPDYIIIMEYIDGIDLKELMLDEPDKPLQFRQSKKIANQCLGALQYAYEKGILHMDIKPSNIMIDKSGNSIIMDFGIAKNIGDRSNDDAHKMLSAAYSSPERFGQAGTVDIRSDIYSLGMVFYELFSGKKPFCVTDQSEIESWHMNGIPLPVKSINSLITPEITAAIKTALEKKPENRFKDFLEFKKAMGFENNTDI